MKRCQTELVAVAVLLTVLVAGCDLTTPVVLGPDLKPGNGNGGGGGSDTRVPAEFTVVSGYDVVDDSLGAYVDGDDRVLAWLDSDPAAARDEFFADTDGGARPKGKPGSSQLRTMCFVLPTSLRGYTGGVDPSFAQCLDTRTGTLEIDTPLMGLTEGESTPSDFRFAFTDDDFNWVIQYCDDAAPYNNDCATPDAGSSNRVDVTYDGADTWTIAAAAGQWAGVNYFAVSPSGPSGFYEAQLTFVLEVERKP